MNFIASPCHLFQNAEGFPLQLVCHLAAGSRSIASVWPVTPTQSACCQWYVTCRGQNNSTCVCPSCSQPTMAVWSSPQRRKLSPTSVRAIGLANIRSSKIYYLTEITHQLCSSPVKYWLILGEHVIKNKGKHVSVPCCQQIQNEHILFSQKNKV